MKQIYLHVNQHPDGYFNLTPSSATTDADVELYFESLKKDIFNAKNDVYEFDYTYSGTPLKIALRLELISGLVCGNAPASQQIL